MASGVINLSIRPTSKLTRGRLIARILIVIAAFAVVFAMVHLPDPFRDSGRGLETRKGGAPTISDRAKPTVGMNSDGLALHLA